MVYTDGPCWLLGIGQYARLIGFLVLLGYFRGWRWGPNGKAERQIWTVWGGYLVCGVALVLSTRLATSVTALEVKMYPGLAVLAGLAFFTLSAHFWGYCALIGLVFCSLPFVMIVDDRWAPLELGATWAAVLLLLGLKLRRLSRQAPATDPGFPTESERPV
jgi:hypothetical protein